MIDIFLVPDKTLLCNTARFSNFTKSHITSFPAQPPVTTNSFKGWYVTQFIGLESPEMEEIRVCRRPLHTYKTIIGDTDICSVNKVHTIWWNSELRVCSLHKLTRIFPSQPTDTSVRPSLLVVSPASLCGEWALIELTHARVFKFQIDSVPS